MELQFGIIFMALSINSVLSQNDGGNITLENKYEGVSQWKIPNEIKNWLEYYNTTALFEDSADKSTCASISQDFGTLAETVGFWVACQDPAQPPECQLYNDCHPTLIYFAGYEGWESLQTVKLTFKVYGLGILRLSIGKSCFDYSIKEDPFSPCEFFDVNKTIEPGWAYRQFIFGNFSTTKFNRFSLELIARFANDAVFLDKVEATEYLLCGYDTTCPTTTTTTTLRSTTLGNTTVNPTTEDDETTAPDIVYTPTTPGSSTSMLTLSSTLTFWLTFLSIVLATRCMV